MFKILLSLLEKGKMDRIKAIDLSHTCNVSESTIDRLIRLRGRKQCFVVLHQVM